MLVNSGHLLENLMFIALPRVMPEILHCATRAGREVDCIVGRQGASRRLVQLWASLADRQIRKRASTAPAEAMSELALPHGIIVMHNEEKQIQVDSGEINAVPAWRFLLAMSERA